MTNQEAKSGNGTPRAPRYPENFSKFSIFSTPANQKTKKTTKCFYYKNFNQKTQKKIPEPYVFRGLGDLFCVCW